MGPDKSIGGQLHPAHHSHRWPGKTLQTGELCCGCEHTVRGCGELALQAGQYCLQCLHPMQPVPLGLSLAGGYEPGGGVMGDALERGCQEWLPDGGVKDHLGRCARGGGWEDGPPSGP